ncbi:hypothetical protein DH2020_042994 [Rehmannia glutinosa]|uniref:Uncharacterized protein n=1 Tax=Rehmannia glutinosa TaxID=99300 RepID=A0ABR0UML1_REHGL
MEKNEKESMEMEVKTPTAANDDEPEINYKGLKTIPLIIVFNMSRISATTLLNVFNGTTNIATLVGAYLSDTYFGRYKTLGFASIASLFGLLVVSLTAVFKNLHPPHCNPSDGPCIGPDAGQMAFLLFGFGLMIIGAGGIRPCNLAFGADQFNPNTDSGKRGIDSFFNWYYFTVTFAEIVSVTLVVYVQSNVSWSIGLAIPTIFMFLSCLMYFVGSKMYVKVKPEGSPLASLVQTDHLQIHGTSAPCNKSKKQNASSESSQSHSQPFSTTSSPTAIRSLPSPPIRPPPRHHRFQIPAASYVIFAMLSLTLWVPIYDRLVVPFTRRIKKNGGGITVLQRIGIGLFITIVESLIGAFVEEQRRTWALRNGTTVSPMSAMWLVPQLALGGLAEAFNAIGQIEFYYKQFPENMRSIAGVFLLWERVFELRL